MTTQQIISEIDKLAYFQQLEVLQKVMASIGERQKEHPLSLTESAKLAVYEYTTNLELTAFNSLDSQDFYEEG